ncbi:MAG: oxidoreductase [Anaerolineaceae bacterium]|nr:oxidoreductase [Anaerolineaceae bacterium]MCB9100983.1 oxidoreductase [Anaerolineales bacterium]
MSEKPFKALLLEKDNDEFKASLKTLSLDDLPEGDVLVSVAYSTLNYKDGLAVTNKGKVVRGFPMIPGIDLAGTVAESSSPDYKVGDQVVLTGWGVGEKYWGGYSQMARVNAGWLVPLPAGLTLAQSMGIGTAGFTAMLSILALEKMGLTPGDGEVVVTGASGGVGSIAVAVLANLGYTVVASTGRVESHDYLKELGAAEVVDRSPFAPSKRPLESARWAGAVDTVGGEILASLLKTMNSGASVAACGNAGGFDLPATVLPFILRGVNLLGIDSVMVPYEPRVEAWRRLAQDLPLEALDQAMHIAPLSNITSLAEDILKGQIRGRLVIDVNA